MVEWSLASPRTEKEDVEALKPSRRGLERSTYRYGRIIKIEEKTIMEKVICPYCGKKAKLVDSIEIYFTRSYGWAWLCLCLPELAYVGCHKGTKRPLGRLADQELRSWKVTTHGAFDKLWKSGLMSRSQAYQWLSEKLDITRGDCHIGLFDVKTCQKTCNLSNKYLKENKNVPSHLQR